MTDKRSILVVDDTPENIDVVVGLLSKKYKVKAAINGEESLEIAFKKTPDLVLLDITIPPLGLISKIYCSGLIRAYWILGPSASCS